ncbi:MULTISPECIES: formate--tetrahydrofolate ligase [Paenibacillus]|uniref:Formate--tetrahydrofolate ligase n=2 Tax=Paenibacillus macerans TaxID=44252 RepID=A0A090XU72_PAEMA|nr:formate--tetrahydrofolate ligase [Paenibacillus macerans]KFM89819.1 formate--tetrahydrofolate ligase [Paenibacillus macerans]MBS5915096.1 formate--tetrahydrofolate ligase [Paenibacillus macerans]MCY7562504.1 formate--tetrahydrofolate ligase [Paenibacillus macerans]MEC0155161.1 formate--tetrahydrofolate ligase [Paenibacillus macerans]MEC0332097.1 formate--tetrahydrofolate ligase [Paenibacillus macerans]
MKPILEIADTFGIADKYLELYGRYKGKLDLRLLSDMRDRPDGKLVLVTAMNPTPAGEGKTLTTIGLAQALNAIGVPSIAALREPSLGPCFGMKGGATGGGKAQILPSEDINLHFTGDLHAITSANNLLAAMIDNHIFQGNALQIDPGRILWKRAMDMNDRSLRQIVVGLGDGNGQVHESGFMITSASEVMAVLCLSEDADDLKRRLGRMVVACNMSGEAVTAAQIGAVDAMTVLLKEAIKPNLVQTAEGSPAIVHGGPFANIAHGCSSVIGTKAALKLAKIVVTEAGFGADLGAEKFFNIKCRQAGLTPDAAVLVVTVKALKYNGGVPKAELDKPNPAALEAGLANIRRHLENIGKFGVPVMVAINHYADDPQDEIRLVTEACRRMGVRAELSDVWAKGSEGGLEMARALQDILRGEPSRYAPLYPEELDIRAKIEAIVREIYRGKGIKLSAKAEAKIRELERLGFGRLAVCMAKTPYSFSDQATLLGAPDNFTVQVRDVTLSAGAGFIVAHTGNIVTMPGLPKSPAAERIRLDERGEVDGLL